MERRKAMNKRLNLVLRGLLIVLMLGGCGVTGGGELLSFQTIVQDNNLNDDERETPGISIMASSQEVDNFVRDVVKVDPQAPDQRQRLVDKLRQLDYKRSFAILVTQGQKGPRGFQIAVQQVTQQDDRITVQAQFIGPKPGEGQPMVVPDPYTLVAVAKESAWGRQMQFALVADGKVVAETMHFIP
jgi:hypothetical protein